MTVFLVLTLSFFIFLVLAGALLCALPSEVLRSLQAKFQMKAPPPHLKSNKRESAEKLSE